MYFNFYNSLDRAGSAFTIRNFKRLNIKCFQLLVSGIRTKGCFQLFVSRIRTKGCTSHKYVQ